jgi:hypothetical protein
MSGTTGLMQALTVACGETEDRGSFRFYVTAAALTAGFISPRREGRGFSSSTHKMRQSDAANRSERRSDGCGLFESRRRSPRRDGAGGALGIAPGCRRRDGFNAATLSMRRPSGAGVGVATAVRLRVAATNRNPPKPAPRSMKWLARKEPVETVAVPAPKYARTISFGRSARMTR